MYTARSKVIFHIMLLASLLATLLGSAAVALPARADVIDVTSTADSGAGTLRQAVLDAASGDTITFSVSGTIPLLSQIVINKDLTISGPGAAVLTLSGGDATRIFDIGAYAVSISGLTIANGYTAGSGAGILQVGGSLTLEDMTFSNNQAPNGFGGGVSKNDGPMVIADSDFIGGVANYGGGVAFDCRNVSACPILVNSSIFSGNSANYGGGLLLYNAILTAAESTFTGNTASAWGGGIIFDGNRNAASTFTLLNSTLAGNSAGQGGGLYLMLSGNATLANSTLSANSAADFGGGLLTAGDGSMALVNDTFSGNSAVNGGGGVAKFSGMSLVNTILANSPSGDDCRDFIGPWGTVAHALMESGTCPYTLLADPNLAPLADNGGPTQTFALLTGSPAIDAGDNAACSAAPVNNLDQRGVTRPADGNGDGNAVCDLGAYEALALSVTTITADTPDPSVTGQTVSVSVTVTGTATTPTGSVSITGADANCNITLAAGSGSCNVTFTSTGAKTLTATYNGDATHGPSTATAGHTVDPADTTTTITADNPDPSAGGGAVSVSYTVAVSAPGSGTPSGNVTVSDGVDSCSGTVAAGSCSLNLTTGGARTLTATYAGDGNFNGSADTEAHTVDASPPQVGGITRSDSSPTNAASVDFRVTFTETVTGVDASDFSLAMGGSLSGASVSGVSGAGATYTVTVGTGAGSGSLRLDVAASNSVEDLAGNPLPGGYFSGESYTVDKDAPVVQSSVRLDANPTHALSVDFRVTFSEAVSGVDAADFSVTGGGALSGASVSGITGAGTTYTVTVGTGTGDGTLRLDVAAANTIEDLAGNPLSGGYFSGESYTVDKTAPLVVSSLRLDANPTHALSVDFRVTFSEAVSGVDAADFSATTGGALSGASVSGVTGSGAVYTVTVGTGSGDGSVRLDVLDDDSIQDAAHNPLGEAYSLGESYTVDKTAPTVVSSLRLDANPTQAASVDFQVTFSEAVSGVDITDFTTSSTGSLSGVLVTGVTGSGATYTVTVSTGSGAGSLRLDVLDDDSVVDAAGNPLAGGYTAGEAYEAGFYYTTLPLMFYNATGGGR